MIELLKLCAGLSQRQPQRIQPAGADGFYIMKLLNASMTSHGFALLLISSLLGEANGYVQKLCSKQNTGAGSNDREYQSFDVLPLLPTAIKYRE